MKIQAYGVHLFTALGAALGLWALLLIFDGFFKEAIWVLGAAGLIDSIDGTLARYFDTKNNAPKYDGSLMDNIIDYTTWTIAPLCWIYATMNIPLWVLMICAVSSIFGFTNTKAKTEDNFFTGFPSYWNIVVLYLFLLGLPKIFAIVCLIIFAVSTFLPVKFVYPTKTDFLKVPTLIFGGLYIVQLVLIVILFEDAPAYLIYSSFLFPIYYFALSFYLNFKKDETLQYS